MTKIIKRDNNISDLDIKEIRKAIEWASKGLNEISHLELESHVMSIYTEKISTEEIQKSLIETALKLTSIDEPEWRILAARLLVMELYKEAGKERNYKEFGYSDYYKFVKEAVEKGLYSEEILALYTEEELKEASDFIKPEYDLDFDYAGISMIINRYLIKNRNDVFELPQEMFLTIALLIASVEKKEEKLKIAKEIYEQIAGKKVSLATPILINLRKPNGNLSSCFITAIDDNLDSIFYNVDEIAQISKNGGGVGVNLSRIRSVGAEINKTPNASGGVIPWIKIINDTAVAVNQLGKRAGAVTVALDIWHFDIEDFLELQTENGDQRKKAYDLFPQVVVNDLFMERVKKGTKWSLFDPNEIRIKYNVEIAELWGKEFEEFYEKIEIEDELKLVKKVNAKDLLKKIMKTQIETGMPYMFFKDTVNETNPNKHDGFIGSGNLCQESFSNFKPTNPGKVKLENGILKRETESGLVHTCNLVSLNLSKLLDRDELKKSSRAAVRILDNAITLTIAPIQESNLHNEYYRTIGVGAMGLADYLAINKLPYQDTPNTLQAVDELFEFISLHVTKMSVELSKVRGSYKKFPGSEWSKGILFGKNKEWFENNSKMAYEWLQLIEDIKKYGIRNSQLMAIAPNTSSALVQGCSSSVLPIFSKFYMDKNAKGVVPICPPFIKDAFWYYQESKTIPQDKIVKIISKIQNWVDQGISMELIYNLNMDIKAKDIYDTIMTAWEYKCKTIYYTRTIQKNSNALSDKEECVSCAN